MNIIQQKFELTFSQNAMVGQARRVWVSFGIFMILFPFMDGLEIVCLQSANKFCYDKAVSRVQHRIPLPETFFFIHLILGSLSDVIVSFSQATGVKILTDKERNFFSIGCIQVGRYQIFQADLYADFRICRMLRSDRNNASSCCTKVSQLSAK